MSDEESREFARNGDSFEPVPANVRRVPARWGEIHFEAGAPAGTSCILLKDSGRGRYPNARIDATRFKYCLPATDTPRDVCGRLVRDAKRVDVAQRTIVHLFSVREVRGVMSEAAQTSREYYMGAHVVVGINLSSIPRFVVLQRLREQRRSLERFLCPSAKQPRGEQDAEEGSAVESPAERLRRREDAARALFLRAVAEAKPKSHTAQVDATAIDSMRACPNADSRYRDAVPEREMHDAITGDLRRGQRVTWCCALAPDAGVRAGLMQRCRALRDVGLHRVVAVLLPITENAAEATVDACEYVDFDASRETETQRLTALGVQARLN
ncbi:hypothetical protein CYMTET_8119 [Cymbomonas tetramitiformis]|uniref:Uncharacterized protein n=1 Tax=Cymbomonas tetramitiformis TaxID=36881 RepID=A0AAE0GTN2_9CHLO|nr:hypothetical protein CYMTET_8119 [Cymbomonas tetramitiformis]|eukprot:gene4038-5011_t